jgi:hypothetical protein
MRQYLKVADKLFVPAQFGYVEIMPKGHHKIIAR